MMNKIFGVKNITHLLYGFLICMPMLSILARTCYVAINKNAKDSYSNQRITNLTQVSNNNMLVENADYFVSYSADTSATNNCNFTVYDSDASKFISSTYTSPVISIAFIVENYARLNITLEDSTIIRVDNWNEIATTISFKLKTTNYTTNNGNISKAKLFLISTTTSKLDNAFEYSLSQFTKDNNLGNVDIFSWFTDLFLDQTNPTNQLYLGFVNWYLNYTLLVSSGYLLFLTLIWFVNYVRRILDKSMNQEYGGF